MIVKPKDVLIALKQERKGKQNICAIFFLDENKKILSIHRHIFYEQSQIKMSDIFIPAFYLSATFLILAQVKNSTTKTNSSKPIVPLEIEMQLTQKIITAGNFLNIQLLDHLIIQKNTYYSFHESGVM